MLLNYVYLLVDGRQPFCDQLYFGETEPPGTAVMPASPLTSVKYKETSRQSEFWLPM
jgi:hypothetical protein